MLLPVLLAPMSLAQSWDGGGGDLNLSTAANWSGDVAPAETGGILTFNNGTTIAATNDFGSLSVARITVQSTNTAVTLSGNSFALTDYILVTAGASLTVTTDLGLVSGSTLGSIGTGNLVVSGGISGAAGLTKASGGMVTLSGTNSYTGGTRINNGTLKLSGSGTLGETSGNLTFQDNLAAKLDLNGTSQTVGNLVQTFSDNGSASIYNNSSGTTSTLTIGQGNATGGDYHGVIVDHTTGTGIVALTKTGTGTQTLSGINTYTGDTTVAGGTLLIKGSLDGGSSLIVASGGTIGGSGTIGGATTIQSGGSLAPGNSPGLLTFGDDLTFDAGSTALFEINGTGRGTTFDAINVGGLTTFGGTLSLTFGSTIDDDSTLNLFSSTGGFAGNFSAVSVGGSYAGSFINSSGQWSLSSGSQLLTFSTATGSLSFSAISAVPEPSTWASLVGTAVFGFAAVRRRRRSVVVEGD